MTRVSAGRYELDDDPRRVDAGVVTGFLTTGAYWGRWRSPDVIERQIAAAWRMVGAYDQDGAMVGFARAFGDGATAYLADVFVLSQHRGTGLGTAIVRLMVDDGPAAQLRWMLHTRDAHDLYRRFGFAPPDDRYLERPARGGLSSPALPGGLEPPPAAT
jgi:GNAT superfamily N-acetyltransferase